jgi:hypothetical protein
VNLLPHDVEARRGNLKHRSKSERVEQNGRAAEGLCQHRRTLPARGPGVGSYT